MKLMSGQGPLCSQKGLKMIKNIFSLLKNEKILDDSFDSKFRNLDRQLSDRDPTTRKKQKVSKFFFKNEIGPSAGPRTEEKQKRSVHVRGITYFQSYKHRDFLIFRDKVSDKEFSYHDF